MKDDLEKLRNNIREIDEQVLTLIKRRIQIAKEIGEIKKRHGLPVVDLKVEKAVIERTLLLSGRIGLDQDFSRKLINSLIAESVRLEEGSPKYGIQYLHDVSKRVRELEARGERIIHLETDEPEFPYPRESKSIPEKSNIGEHEHVESSKISKELRKALTANLTQEYGVDLDEKQILITPSGKSAVFAAIVSMISQGDRVVIPKPATPVYEECVRLVGGRVDIIHTRLEEDWHIDEEKVTETLNIKPKLLVLSNPNNPTGKITSGNEIKEIIQLIGDRATYVLSDETYSGYASEKLKSILQVASSSFININDFSKYGMTGSPTGYIVSDIKTISKIHRVLQVSAMTIPNHVLKTALKALTLDSSKFDILLKEAKERIELACNIMDRFFLDYYKPEGGIHIFPKCGIKHLQSVDFTSKLLEKKGVAVLPGETFGDYSEHFRVSLGTNKPEIITGIKKIGEIIEEWPKH